MAKPRLFQVQAEVLIGFERLPGNSTDSIVGSSLGLVKINFSYLDSISSPTIDLSKIKYIKTELWIEPTEPIKNFITGNQDSVFTYW